MNGVLEFDATKLIGESVTLQVEMRLTGMRWFKFRLWLGSRIFKIGARIIGCGIEIKPCRA
jgi:hypothetical protein